MKKLILLLVFIAPFLLQAQEKGLQFQETMSWAAVQAKAKAENKYIFMDCFTTWCGPCKFMSAQVFPKAEVGSFMNDKFVSVAVQLDTTQKDNDHVKSWYKDGYDIATKYDVRAYPTYLIFNSQGEVVHRFVGSSEADEFLANTKKSLDPSSQYYTLLKKYKAGNREPQFLKTMATAASDAYDMKMAHAIAEDYLATQKDLYTNENLEFVKKFTQKSTDKGFNIFLQHPEKVDGVLGKGSAAATLQPIIMKEEIYKYFPQNRTSSPDWKMITEGITKKYPAQAPEALSKAKVLWYQNIGDWENFQVAVVNYMKNYGSAANANELNSYAWAVFENCKDMKCVAEALDWSKRSFADNNNPAFMDTYANILYKLGKKDEAIAWEEKAKNASPENEKQGYNDTIEKMKRGDKTWN